MNRYTFKLNTPSSFVGTFDTSKECGTFKVNVTVTQIIVKAESFDEAVNKASEVIKGVIKELSRGEVTQTNILELTLIEVF